MAKQISISQYFKKPKLDIIALQQETNSNNTGPPVAADEP